MTFFFSMVLKFSDVKLRVAAFNTSINGNEVAKKFTQVKAVA